MKNVIFLSAILSVFLCVPNLWAQDFVVVSRDTKFFSTASGTKPFSRPNNEKGFLTLELLEENEERVQVRIAPEKKSSCYSQSPIFEASGNASQSKTELRLWVNRRSLEKVTRERLSWTFSDGSEVEIAAGMVVRGKNILTKNSSLHLSIPGEKIGFSFQKEYLVVGVSKRSIPLISERGIEYDRGKYFKKSIFREVENIGTFAQVKNKCVRVRGRLNAKKIRYDTFDEAEVLIEVSEKTKSKRTNTAIFMLGEVQRHDLEKERELDRLIVSVHGKEPVEKYAWLRSTKIKIGKMKIKGANPAMIEKAFQQKTEDWKGCYLLYKDSRLEGTVSIQVKIATDGMVKSTTLVQSSLYNRRMERCLLWRLRKTHFKPMGETTVILPLKFWSVE